MLEGWRPTLISVEIVRPWKRHSTVCLVLPTASAAPERTGRSTPACTRGRGVVRGGW